MSAERLHGDGTRSALEKAASAPQRIPKLEDIPAHQGVGLIDTMNMTGGGIDLPARKPARITVV